MVSLCLQACNGKGKEKDDKIYLRAEEYVGVYEGTLRNELGNDEAVTLTLLPDYSAFYHSMEQRKDPVVTDLFGTYFVDSTSLILHRDDSLSMLFKIDNGTLLPMNENGNPVKYEDGSSMMLLKRISKDIPTYPEVHLYQANNKLKVEVTHFNDIYKDNYITIIQADSIPITLFYTGSQGANELYRTGSMDVLVHPYRSGVTLVKGNEQRAYKLLSPALYRYASDDGRSLEVIYRIVNKNTEHATVRTDSSEFVLPRSQFNTMDSFEQFVKGDTTLIVRKYAITLKIYDDVYEYKEVPIVVSE